MGNAVDPGNLTRQLTLFRQAGLGGVEICPIYGVKGAENRFIDFLSPRWMEMLAHTTGEARRLDLGVDLTTGTGWPFGGPGVGPEDASAKIVMQAFDVPEGSLFRSPLPKGSLRCLRAVPAVGEQIDLTDKFGGGRLDWTSPRGSWRLYALCSASPVQQVKRAAPGGAGNVLDPYSADAVSHYLARFDTAFAGWKGAMPRAHFHDSFEYFGATWTNDMFARFAELRGYDLRTQLPALFGEGTEDTIARVKYDYRVTLGELHQAYMRRWKEWAHLHNGIVRNQAHGAPANLVDLYANADIPETEIFGSIAERNLPMNKMASSAAHLAGRPLTSAESFTWLNEPFQASLSEVKQATDYLFLAGVNHIFFHGIPYSPADAPWPGWQFYAAVNFGPDGGLWDLLPEFNAYATRCQSVLQSGAPANDVLLYFPLHDIWQTPQNLLMPFTVHNVGEWLAPHPFYAAAMKLWDRGYGYDHVSDRLLTDARCESGRVAVGANSWRVVVVPECRLMPAETLGRLISLARAGSTVIVLGKIPEDVPGFARLDSRRVEFRRLRGEITLQQQPGGTFARAAVGRGAFLVGTELEELLKAAGVAREPCVDLGLRFVRRTHPLGCHYFLANRGTKAIDGWIALGTPAAAAVIMDPREGDRAGAAALRRAADGSTEVYLQLGAGESCILRTFLRSAGTLPPWPYVKTAGAPLALSGTWRVRFIEGGPVLPASYETDHLASWTARDDPEAQRFAGTARYVLDFEGPVAAADDWLLDLGAVAAGARVRINGQAAGVLWCAPFTVRIGPLLRPGRNTLEIDVVNLAANRIRDLDRRKVNWKYFYDANVLNRNYQPLDASTWPLLDSGLLGPVTITPLCRLAL